MFTDYKEIIFLFLQCHFLSFFRYINASDDIKIVKFEIFFFFSLKLFLVSTLIWVSIESVWYIEWYVACYFKLIFNCDMAMCYRWKDSCSSIFFLLWNFLQTFYKCASLFVSMKLLKIERYFVSVHILQFGKRVKHKNAGNFPFFSELWKWLRGHKHSLLFFLVCLFALLHHLGRSLCDGNNLYNFYSLPTSIKCLKLYQTSMVHIVHIFAHNLSMHIQHPKKKIIM